MPGKLQKGKWLLVGCFIVACWSVCGYFLKVRGVPVLQYEKQWSIAMFTGPSPFDLTGSNVRNPVLRAEDISDVSASYVADPFIISKDALLFMFFEVFSSKKNHGNIGYAKSADGFSWKYGSIVLDEPFHLSYPYVFEWENEYYMAEVEMPVPFVCTGR